MTEQLEAAVTAVSAFLDRNYSHDTCDLDCPGNLDEAATIVEMVLSALAPEYGAQDIDDPARIFAHRSYELAADAASWWSLDGLVYVRQVTEWKVLDD